MKYSLIEAIMHISFMSMCHPFNITFIEFEDGSGLSFNFSIDNGAKQHIRLDAR